MSDAPSTRNAKLSKGLYRMDASPFIYGCFKRANGAYFRGSLKTSDPKEAKLKLEQMRVEDYLGRDEFFDKKHKQASLKKFKEVIDDAREYQRKHTDCYDDFYKFTFNLLEDNFGQLPLHEVTFKAVEDFKNGQLARRKSANPENHKTISKTTINSYLITLKVCFNVAVENGYIKKDKVPSIRLFELAPGTPKSWEEDELKSLFATSASVPDAKGVKFFPMSLLRDLIYVAFFSYMRQGEELELTVENAKKIESNGIKGISFFLPDTKNGTNRAAPVMGETVCEIVDRLSVGKKPTERLFTWKGAPLTKDNFKKAFKALLKLAKLRRGTWHWLRHSGITWDLMGGTPLNVVMKKAGHKSLATTNLYNDAKEKMVQEMSVSFGKFIEGRQICHKNVIVAAKLAASGRVGGENAVKAA